MTRPDATERADSGAGKQDPDGIVEGTRLAMGPPGDARHDLINAAIARLEPRKRKLERPPARWEAALAGFLVGLAMFAFLIGRMTEVESVPLWSFALWLRSWAVVWWRRTSGRGIARGGEGTTPCPGGKGNDRQAHSRAPTPGPAAAMTIQSRSLSSSSTDDRTACPRSRASPARAGGGAARMLAKELLLRSPRSPVLRKRMAVRFRYGCRKERTFRYGLPGRGTTRPPRVGCSQVLHALAPGTVYIIRKGNSAR